MDEFSLIRHYFAPLSRGFPGAAELTDDAAILSPPAGGELVITKDAITQGIHFLGSEDASLIARKLLRVNLSDLSAMGAEPIAYFLAVMLPKNTAPKWVQHFAEGLREDQQSFDIHLAGGDTISIDGAPSFSVTAIGSVPAGKALLRSGARPGDTIYVSGTLGDSALGLKLLQHRDGLDARLTENDRLYLKQRYFLPEPKLALGQRLRGIASACMDISDGLLQDLGHLCRASHTGALIDRDELPLSIAAEKLISDNASVWASVFNGGDDYELLFTAPVAKAELVEKLSLELELPLTAIGRMTQEHEVVVTDGTGHVLPMDSGGFKHF